MVLPTPLASSRGRPSLPPVTSHSPEQQPARDAEQARAELEEPWQRAFDWIESELGGRIVAFDRQTRWRPAFFLELERGGETLPLYLRGERGALDHGVYPLEHESRVLQVLEAQGLPVPHVYGFHRGPDAILMDRMPGRANLATADSEEEGRAVLDHYMDLLADLHSLDPQCFEEIGIERPRGAQALGLCDLDRWEQSYRKGKEQPEPLIEFVTGWLKRNVPTEREEVSCLVVDSGQFLFEQGRVTSLLDVELATLGDPAADLAGMRGRDLAEPLGDLPRAFERYFEKRGARIPKEIIDYHTVRFNLATPYTTAPLIADPPPEIDLCVYLGWNWVWSRACIEIMADSRGLELEKPHLPDAIQSPFSRSHEFVVDRLRDLREGKEDSLRYEIDKLYRSARYLQRAEGLGAALAADEAAEIDALLGRATTPQDREAELEAFVLEHGADREAELMQLFSRRCLRQEAIMGPTLRELSDVRTQLIPR